MLGAAAPKLLVRHCMCCLNIFEHPFAVECTQWSVLHYLRTLSVCVMPADRIFASIIKRVSAVLRQLLRVDEARAHVPDLQRETRHQRISLTTVTIEFEHLLQAVFGYLDQVNILIALDLRHLVFNMMSYLVNMMRTNPFTTSVPFPEANLIKIDTRQVWLAILLCPG